MQADPPRAAVAWAAQIERRFQRQDLNRLSFLLWAALGSAALLGGCTSVPAPSAKEAARASEPDSEEGQDAKGDTRDAAQPPDGDLIATGTDSTRKGSPETESESKDAQAQNQADAAERSGSDASGTDAPNEPKGPADPCLTDNGGCQSNQSCSSRDGEVSCSDCPPGSIDPDGECGPALRQLAVAEAALDQPFSSTQRSYRVVVPLTVQQVTISARALPGVVVQIDGVVVGEEAHRSGLLAVGDTSFDIIVRGERAHDRRYNLTVRREGRLASYLKGDDTDETDNFGRAIALHGDRVAVGAFYADGIGNATADVGAVYVFKRDGESYTQTDRLTPQAPETSAFFGGALAMNEDTLFVGAPFIRLVGSQKAAGRVYVYSRDGELWNEQPFIQPAQGHEDDWFGVTMTLSGNTLAVGAAKDGSVYIYEKVGESWQFSQQLTHGAADPSVGQFGSAIALHGDTLVVGAPELNDGAAYVFERDGTGTFGAPVTLTIAEPPPAARFGTSVAVYGNVLAVGAPGALRTTDFSHSGADAVYLFDRTADGWRARTQAVSSSQSENSAFGQSVLLLSETTLVVGAPEARAAGRVFGAAAGGSGVPATGGVYLYANTGNGFIVDRLLNAAQPGELDWFGYTIASDGVRLGITAMHEGSKSRTVDGDAADNSCNQCGAAYIFE